MAVAEPKSGDQQLATRSAKPIDAVRAALEKLKPQLAMALPRHLTPDRLLRVALSAIQTTPKLLDCDRTSLYAAVMTCAQLGLEPDGVLGQAYLVPFKGRVQFIPGYRGLISLARNSGEVTSIDAHEVYAKDQFDYAYGLNDRLAHRPSADVERGEITHFYAIAKFRDGGYHFVVMTAAEVERVRDASEGWRAFKAGKIRETPWATHYAEMGKKTAIRRMAKYLPLNVQKAAALADLYDAGKTASLDQLGDIVIDVAASSVEEAAAAASRLDAFAAGALPAGTEAAVAEQTTPSPDLAPAEFLSAEAVANLFASASKSKLPEEELAEHLAELYGGTDAVPAADHLGVLDWIRKAAKERRG